VRLCRLGRGEECATHVNGHGRGSSPKRLSTVARDGSSGAPVVERQGGQPRELLLATMKLLGLRKKRGRR
jgi:hypothetical protein